MPNGWNKKYNLQGFGFDIHFEKCLNIFDQMEISELIYEGVVLPYKNPTERSDANHAGLVRKQIGQIFYSSNNSNNFRLSVNIKSIHSDNPSDKLIGKHCMIHGSVN